MCDMEIIETNEYEYKSIVGNLLYFAHFCLDINFVVRCVNRFITNPEASHMDVAINILKYLEGTSSHGIYSSLEIPIH